MAFAFCLYNIINRHLTSFNVVKKLSGKSAEIQAATAAVNADDFQANVAAARLDPNCPAAKELMKVFGGVVKTLTEDVPFSVRESSRNMGKLMVCR